MDSRVNPADESRQAFLVRSRNEEHAYDKEEQIDVDAIFLHLLHGHSSDDKLSALEVLGGDGKAPPFSWKKLWLFTGPGFLMSIAYLDPGNIESDLQSGVVAGYSLLWLLLWATAMGLVIQMLSARVGVATGCDLAQICRDEYPFWARIVLWIMAEFAIIGADIQEVIGSAIALRILSGGYIPLWAGVLVTGVDGFVFLFLENYGIRKLEAFFGVLISIMAASFAWMFGKAQPDARDLAVGLIVPRIPSVAVSQAVGVVGALIMPHNIFLHSALVQSRSINICSSFHVKEALRYYTIESCVALFVSFLINLFVVSVFAKAFFGSDIAESIGLVNAGEYLQEKYGGGYFPILYIWAIGLLAAGQSSTMTGTYAGQFVMAGFLNLKVKKWMRAFVTRAVAIIPTVIVALIFNGSDDELDRLNEWLNILQSVQLPFALIPLLSIVSKEHIMGVFKIGSLLQAVSWLIAALVLIINGYLLVEFCSTYIDETNTVISILAVLTTLYILFIVYLIVQSHSRSRIHLALKKWIHSCIGSSNFV